MGALDCTQKTRGWVKAGELGVLQQNSGGHSHSLDHASAFAFTSPAFHPALHASGGPDACWLC